MIAWSLVKERNTDGNLIKGKGELKGEEMWRCRKTGFS